MSEYKQTRSKRTYKPRSSPTKGRKKTTDRTKADNFVPGFEPEFGSVKTFQRRYSNLYPKS